MLFFVCGLPGEGGRKVTCEGVYEACKLVGDLAELIVLVVFAGREACVVN